MEFNLLLQSIFWGKSKEESTALSNSAAFFTWPQIKTLATAPDDLSSVLGTYVTGGENQLA